MSSSDRLAVLAVSILVLSVVAAPIAGATAQAETPTVEISDAEVDVGGTTTVTIALDSAPGGVAGFDLVASVANESVVTVTDVAVASPFTDINDDSRIRDGGAEAYATGTDLNTQVEPGATDATLVTLTLEGQTDGWTTLSLPSLHMDNDEGGNDIRPDTQVATIVVGDAAAPADGTPSSGGDDTAGNETTGDETTENTTTTEAPSGGNTGGQSGESNTGTSAEFETVDVDDGATVNVRSVPSGGSVEANLTGSASGEGVSLTGLSAEMTFSTGDFRFEAGEPTAEPQSAPPIEDSEADAVGYFTLDAINLDQDRMDSANVTLDVATDELPEGASAEDLVVYRYNDGSWTALETSVTADGQITAETPGFSPFAVGAAEETATATATATTESASGPSSAEGTTATATAGATPEPTTTDGPGFGAAVALLALALLGTGLARRD